MEVVAAIKRRTRSKSLAERVKNGLKDIDTIKFSDLISSRADSAAELAKETGVRGMDAIVVQIAKEFKAPLVSLDGEMTKRAKMVVEIVNIEDMVNL